MKNFLINNFSALPKLFSSASLPQTPSPSQKKPRPKFERDHIAQIDWRSNSTSKFFDSNFTGYIKNHLRIAVSHHNHKVQPLTIHIILKKFPGCNSLVKKYKKLV